MSDDFIPLNQSTPVRKIWQDRSLQPGDYIPLNQSTPVRKTWQDRSLQPGGYIPLNQSTPVRKVWQDRSLQPGGYIPLSQSTPVRKMWHDRSLQPRGYQNNWQQRNPKRKRQSEKHWAHNSQHSNSFGSDCNSSYDKVNKSNIDAYLHPSMLKDPWENLQPKTQQKL